MRTEDWARKKVNLNHSLNLSVIVNINQFQSQFNLLLSLNLILNLFINPSLNLNRPVHTPNLCWISPDQRVSWQEIGRGIRQGPSCDRGLVVHHVLGGRRELLVALHHLVHRVDRGRGFLGPRCLCGGDRGEVIREKIVCQDILPTESH